MENTLASISSMIGTVWDWTVHLNGGLQIVLVLVSCVASGACMIIARRMQMPSMSDSRLTNSMAASIIAVIAWILAVILAIITLFGLAAVFAPLLGFATL